MSDPIVEVVYIAFGALGLAPLERFLTSYKDWRTGCPHVLTVALKGYADDADRRQAADKCRRIGAVVIAVPDGGLDIGTYFHVAARSRSDILCLLNSNAVILAEDWLGKLVNTLRAQGGGAVSATGSWESLASDQWRLMPDGPVGLVRWLLRFGRLLRHFPAFPNAHLRTNALALRREDLLGWGPIYPRTKEKAWRFESGRTGLSTWFRRRGLPVTVVGRDGRAFGPSQWAESETFWQGSQANLLVADNQTQRYTHGDMSARRALQESAWTAPRQKAFTPGKGSIDDR